MSTDFTVRLHEKKWRSFWTQKSVSSWLLLSNGNKSSNACSRARRSDLRTEVKFWISAPPPPPPPISHKENKINRQKQNKRNNSRLKGPGEGEGERVEAGEGGGGRGRGKGERKKKTKNEILNRNVYCTSLIAIQSDTPCKVWYTVETGHTRSVPPHLSVVRPTFSDFGLVNDFAGPRRQASRLRPHDVADIKVRPRLRHGRFPQERRQRERRGEGRGSFCAREA